MIDAAQTLPVDIPLEHGMVADFVLWLFLVDDFVVAFVGEIEVGHQTTLVRHRTRRLTRMAKTGTHLTLQVHMVGAIRINYSIF